MIALTRIQVTYSYGHRAGAGLLMHSSSAGSWTLSSTCSTNQGWPALCSLQSSAGGGNIKGRDADRISKLVKKKRHGSVGERSQDTLEDVNANELHPWQLKMHICTSSPALNPQICFFGFNISHIYIFYFLTHVPLGSFHITASCNSDHVGLFHPDSWFCLDR